MKSKLFHKCITFLTFLFLGSFTLYGQTVTGVVYDAKSALKNIKVTNTTREIATYTGPDGFFTIRASVNDTLVFSSLFYVEKKVQVTEASFNSTMVIELKEALNNLNEVVVTDEGKRINEEKFSAQVQNQFKLDYQLHPFLYRPPNGNISNALFLLGRAVKKLFKTKKKGPEIQKTIGYQQLDSLFSQDDTVLNDAFLVKDLSIPLEYKSLFFEYVEVQELNDTLLVPENRVLLLEELFKHGKAFKALLKEAESGELKD